MKWFYNLKVSTKLISAFVIVSLMTAGMGFLGVYNINEISKLDTKMYETMTEPLGLLINISVAYERMRVGARDIIIADDMKEIPRLENAINEESQKFDKSLDEFTETLFTEEGQQLVARLKNEKMQYMNDVSKMIALVREGQRAQAITVIYEDGKAVAEQLEATVDRMIEAKFGYAKQATDDNSSRAKSATVATITIVLIVSLLAMGLGIFISSTVSRPVKKLMDFADKIAEGDLSVEVDINTKDEMGLLTNSLRRMLANTNEVMHNIQNASDQVAAGSKQVSDSSIDLSQGATEQASSIEQLTASIEEISAQTKNNADSANHANELAEHAKENAISGNSQMQEMLDAMEEINESSSNISRVIKVIDDIAFQTNILALNAAVEAARAGQHGKGFAVVAEEVRNLAARSADAAKETTHMIEGSIKKVEGGTKIATETAAALDKIVNGVAQVADIVSNIATASNEQAFGIEQINQGVMQVSQVVQTNSATSEESAAASEELSSQAELLKEQVLRFKLKDTNYSSYSETDQLSPEVLKMLQNMDRNKNHRLQDGLYEENNSNRRRAKNIALSDNEFGKY